MRSTLAFPKIMLWRDDNTLPKAPLGASAFVPISLTPGDCFYMPWWLFLHVAMVLLVPRCLSSSGFL